MAGDALLTRVVAVRGGAVESEHRVAWCVVEPDGAVVGPDPDLPVFARSAVKPLQALGSVRVGVLERFGLGDRHLALACASHGGSAVHVATVAEVLAACELVEDALACGPELPIDPRAAAGVRPSRIRHNCSGKHAFGLAFAASEGWRPGGYIDKGHPLQDAMENGLAEATGVRPGELTRATDGCGMRTFSVPIGRLAAAFGRLASGGLGEAGEQLSAAMSAHPGLVAYDGAIDTELMRAHPKLVSKIGAEGVLGIGLPDGRGAALKVLDGATRALDVVAPLLLEEHWEIAVDTPALRTLRTGPVLNSRGEPVGGAEATLAA